MAINTGLTLFFLMLVLITIHCLIPDENLSGENINEILDKLIHQTQQINETVPNEDIQDLTPNVETEKGNDSNIYYIKTYMPPIINFKSNTTDQSHEMSNEAHSASSEEFPGASKLTRKAAFHKQFTPRIIHEGQENVYSEFKVRSGDLGENEYFINDLIEKEILAQFNTSTTNKTITNHFNTHTVSGHQNQNPPHNLLHQYPEIIIDHITYDNNENDKNKVVQVKSVHESQHMQNVAKEETTNKLSTSPPRKIRYNIPEEEVKIADHKPPEHIETRNYLTPELKDMIDTMIHKKVAHDVLMKQTTENESRKQSKLLEKILQKLPDKRQMTNNVKSSYTLHHERITPVKMEMRSVPETHIQRNVGNYLTKTYLNVPLRPSKWEIHNHLMKTLTRVYRPDTLKRTRVVTGLINRIVPNIQYRPVFYDLYKK